MKRLSAFGAALCALCLDQSAAAAPAPFSRSAAEFVRDEIHVGINIGNTFDVPSGNETDWGNVPVTRELVHAIKAKGFDTVRLPVTWTKRFDHHAPGHPIEPAFLARVKQVVGWCLSEGLVTVVNLHHDGGDDGPPFAWLTIDGDPAHLADADEILRDVWTQIAREMGGAGERLVFEAFNEVRKAKSNPGPDGRQKGKEDWTGRQEYFDVVNRWAEIFVEAVRATGGNNAKRYLMVPTYAAGFQDATCAGWRDPEPGSGRIIADIHCYEPGDFCLWGSRKKHDPAHASRRLGLFFPLFKKYFTDKGVPLVLGEVNAQRRWMDDLHLVPNDAERMKWARQYAEAARKYGFPILLWENGGDWDMGLVDRRTAEWTKPELAGTFLAAWHGKLDDATFGKWLAAVEARNAPPPPPEPGAAGDTVLRWAVGGPENYSGCWGETMGYGNVNGNGVVLKFFTWAQDGSLHVDTHGAGGNMVHQQFWADKGLEARRSWAAWKAGSPDASAKGRSLHCTLTAKNGTSVFVKGAFFVPGLGKIPFGADNHQPGCFLATPERPVVEIDVPLPEGTIDLAGKGIGAELQFIPGEWGRNLPLDADLSAVEIR
ncbi:MAG: glycoside hydrolase family 5 protein [Kiritimatiellae bacterium]|nr:glycoside hydrolase family 5 protein [Kiritimatiellia bacterium]